jgi:hypothetical protein
VFYSDARSAGMSNAYTVISGQSSCISNPAGLSSLKSPITALSYTNYYGFSGLGAGALTFSLPLGYGNFGFGLISSGFTMMTENRITLSYGRSLSKNLRAGVSMNWLNFNQPVDYPDLYGWIPSLGIQWLPGKKVITGLSVFNPAAQEYIPKGYKSIPAFISVGMGFKPSDEFLMLFEVQKVSKKLIRLTLGVETAIKKCFYMRFGVNRESFTGYSAGAGYINKIISMDFAISHHPVLGFSPSFTSSFSF